MVYYTKRVEVACATNGGTFTLLGSMGIE